MAAHSLATDLLDRTGVLASIGCAVHCLVAPVFMLLAPAIGGWWVHPVTHLLIAAIVLPVAGMALVRGYRQHGRRWIPLVGGIGMMLVGIGVVLPWTPTTASSPAMTGAGDCAVCQECCPTVRVDPATGAWGLDLPAASIVTMLGGLALIIAHAGNLRCACQSCEDTCALT
jgi:hypothetical protein